MTSNRQITPTQEPAYMQHVHITMTDGTTGVFTGPAIVKPGDNIGVKSIAFSVPEELPPGYRFGAIE